MSVFLPQTHFSTLRRNSSPLPGPFFAHLSWLSKILCGYRSCLPSAHFHAVTYFSLQDIILIPLLFSPSLCPLQSLFQPCTHFFSSFPIQTPLHLSFHFYFIAPLHLLCPYILYAHFWCCFSAHTSYSSPGFPTLLCQCPTPLPSVYPLLNCSQITVQVCAVFLWQTLLTENKSEIS